MTISTSIIESESLQPKKTSLSYFTEMQLKAGDSMKNIFFFFLQIMVRAFLTHDEASGWRRGVTNSVLVGRALLASGWAFHGLA